MDIKAAAAALDGNEYGKEGSRELFAAMKAAGLVAVFGASDDLVEFRGAIYDEDGAGERGRVPVSAKGLPASECPEGDDCPYFKATIAGLPVIETLWCAEPGFSWTYRTSIPHETFVIMEDGEPYCRGIVFALADIPAAD